VNIGTNLIDKLCPIEPDVVLLFHESFGAAGRTRTGNRRVIMISLGYMICAHCRRETTNPKFCSRSCSASVSNKTSPKKQKTGRTCRYCNGKYTGRARSCPQCVQLKLAKLESRKDLTKGNYSDRDSVKGAHPSWTSVHIRILNRAWNKAITLLPCANCAYSRHVELAHIRSVTSFPLTATLREINAPSNIIPLCRNCHWEFDHGILVLDLNGKLELAA